MSDSLLTGAQGEISSAAALPGAPALLNTAIGLSGSTLVLQLADTLGLSTLLSQAAWGIYKTDGTLAIEADSVVDFDFVNDDSIANYPLEGGDFRSYNKVQTPFTVKVTLALSGTLSFKNILSAVNSDSFSGITSSLTGISARTKFIATLDTLQQSLDLLNFVTPEKTYQNVTVAHHEITRSAQKGITLLQANIWLQEVRLSAVTTYKNTKTPAAADAVCVGQVQPTPYYLNPLPKPQ